MAEFKPMVKMETTEPSVILKLKKGGSAHKKMKSDAKSGHKAMAHKMDGGIMGALSGATPVIAGQTAAPVARMPMRPSMASRRKAMMPKPGMSKMPMKKGGKACYATGGSIVSETTSGTPKTTLVHSSKVDNSPAKTGEVKEGNGGGYKKGGKVKMATGGVMKSNAGGYASGGSIPSETIKGDYDVTKVDTAKPDSANGTKGVRLGNAGGFKKGGTSKKAYATGGSVQNDGRAVALKIPGVGGKKAPAVAINMLSGTYKKGGKVTNVGNKRLQSMFDSENAPEMKDSKKDSNYKYGNITYQEDAVSKAPTYKKSGGEVESKSMHASEMKKFSKIENELKSHENKKASIAHKGLKKGGKC
jgi:hypothetical protein